MIDADIRHIIEPELMDGEELLWAEKIDSLAKLSWVKGKILTDRFAAVFYFAIAALLIIGYFKIGSGVLLAFGLFVLVGAIVFARAFYNSQKYFLENNISSYGLTNSHVFFFGPPDQQCEKYKLTGREEIRIKKEFIGIKWIASHLLFGPVESEKLDALDIDTLEFYFLRDFEKSAAQINRIIREKTS